MLAGGEMGKWRRSCAEPSGQLVIMEQSWRIFSSPLATRKRSKQAVRQAGGRLVLRSGAHKSADFWPRRTGRRTAGPPAQLGGPFLAHKVAAGRARLASGACEWRWRVHWPKREEECVHRDTERESCPVASLARASLAAAASCNNGNNNRQIACFLWAEDKHLPNRVGAVQLNSPLGLPTACCSLLTVQQDSSRCTAGGPRTRAHRPARSRRRACQLGSSWAAAQSQEWASPKD